MESWANVWNNRDVINIEKRISTKNIVDNLLINDGFDSPTGKIETDSWISFIESIKQRFSILPSESIFEVGCGSGAFLYPFYDAGHNVGGIDYSKKLIDSCKKIFHNQDFILEEAINLNSDKEYDYTIAFSVLFYFENYSYAENVIRKMIKKSRKGVLLLDIPDLATKEECEKFRRSTMSYEEYEKKYKDLKHLYFPRGFFTDIANSNHIKKCHIENQSIKGYLNNNYRFNCYLIK